MRTGTWASKRDELTRGRDLKPENLLYKTKACQ